jgi:hypothetical protein
MPQLYIVDLDRTLFETKVFARDLLTSLVTHFAIDPHTFRDQIPQYTLPNEVGYDFFAHATTVTGQTADSILRAVEPHLSRHDYAYSDVAGWVARHSANTIVIVTVGTPAYQGLKLKYAPSIKYLPHFITPDNKGKLIRTILDTGSSPNLNLDLDPYDRITVIDDNPDTFANLGQHPRIDGIYVSRPGEKYAGQPVPSYLRTITTLEELL